METSLSSKTKVVIYTDRETGGRTDGPDATLTVTFIGSGLHKGGNPLGELVGN